MARYIVLLVVACAAALAPACSRAGGFIPAGAARYRAELARAAHAAWGLSAPVADFAAQIEQESGWDPGAVSAAGALGMAQFMPATAAWWCALPLSPALSLEGRGGETECAPTNPTWALRALAGYDRWLWERLPHAADGCERMAMALAAYNGGLGWVRRDAAAARAAGADPAVWFGSVERYNAGRSPAAFAENRAYPRRVLRALAPKYLAWGAASCG